MPNLSRRQENLLPNVEAITYKIKSEIRNNSQILNPNVQNRFSNLFRILIFEFRVYQTNPPKAERSFLPFPERDNKKVAWKEAV